MDGSVFKTCPHCQQEWRTQDDFMDDQSLLLNGYKADFEELEYGLFFFTHDRDDCHSTMALEVRDFMNLYDGQIHPQRKTGTDECPRYCHDEEQLGRCDAICECSFVREIIQIIGKRRGLNDQ